MGDFMDIERMCRECSQYGLDKCECLGGKNEAPGNNTVQANKEKAPAVHQQAGMDLFLLDHIPVEPDSGDNAGELV